MTREWSHHDPAEAAFLVEPHLMTVDVRDAVIEDAEAIGRLITELGYPTTHEEMRQRLVTILADAAYGTFVADAGANVVGVTAASLGRYYEKDGVYSRLLVLAVSSTVQGLGIGSRLVEAVERWSVARGARDVIVTSALRRVEAHGFYERRGYARTGYRFVKQL
jgi:GNAT superfamily N-acetyltransferase